MKTWKTPKGTELPLLNLKGKDYLQVAQRLVWFREEKPTWTILTSFLVLDDTHTIAKAEIIDEGGRVIATAHKREDKQHFLDHMEKAEAGAVGRALAYIGYGTQFCAEEIDEGARIVDTPIDRISKSQPISPREPNIRRVEKATPLSAAEYLVNFGTAEKGYYGMTLKSAVERDGLPRVQLYINRLIESREKEKKSVPGNYLEMRERLNEYAQSIQNDVPNFDADFDEPIEFLGRGEK